MIQLRMTGKDIRLSEGNSLFPSGNMKLFTAVIGRKMLFKQVAEPCAFPLGDQNLAVFVDNLYRKPDTAVKGVKHGAKSFFRNNGI